MLSCLSCFASVKEEDLSEGAENSFINRRGMTRIKSRPVSR